MFTRPPARKRRQKQNYLLVAGALAELLAEPAVLPLAGGVDAEPVVVFECEPLAFIASKTDMP